MYNELVERIFEAFAKSGDRYGEDRFAIWLDAHRDLCEKCNETDRKRA